MASFLFVFFYYYLHKQPILAPLHCLSALMWLFLVPEPMLETTVGEDVNSVVLLNLLPGAEYNVQLTASYPMGESEPLLVNAKTCRCPHTTLFLLSHGNCTTPFLVMSFLVWKVILN